MAIINDDGAVKPREPYIKSADWAKEYRSSAKISQLYYDEWGGMPKWYRDALRKLVEAKVPEHGFFHQEYTGDWITTKSKKGKTMSSLVKKIKTLTLSKDERLLREHGLVDEDGTATHDGIDVMDQILFEEYKSKVVEKLKAVLADEKESK